MFALILFSSRLTAWIPLSMGIALLWIAPASGGDVIYFKDGMRTLCHGKAWEEKDEVHCEYGGGLLIYPKKEVSRIEKASAPAQVPDPKDSPDPEPPHPPPGGASAFTKPPAALGPSPKPAAGILFYDPRREKKYWSSANAHHDSYSEALSALATEFDRPASWIEGNMGESNDLLEIRNSLAVRSRTSGPSPPEMEGHASAGGIQFYNPRRPKKYWTSSDAQHDTLGEAIQSFAAEFGKPAAWIELHMGEVNDVEQIRRSLNKAQAGDPGK